MARWSMNLEQFSERQKRKINKIRKKFVFNLYSAIVTKTPVDTGRARGNWQISVNSPQTQPTENKSVLHTDEGSVPNANGDESYYIANGLPYIVTLEYGGYPDPVKKGTYNKRTGQYEIRSQGGYSKQAPEGMVGVTLVNAQALLDQAVNDS